MEPQKPAVKPPKPAMSEAATAMRTDGTRLFRLINFELFAVRHQTLSTELCCHDNRELEFCCWTLLYPIQQRCNHRYNTLIDCDFRCMQTPTPRMRMLSIAGSGLFVGIIGYFTWFVERPEKRQPAQRS